MRIETPEGLLTTRPPESSDCEPVFIRDGVACHPDDTVDLGEAVPEASRHPSACDLVADGYARAVDAGRWFSRSEYNVIARFAGLPSMNPCSGE